MISMPPRMVIQQSMARTSSSFYHASATTPPANYSDFFNTHACLRQLFRSGLDFDWSADTNQFPDFVHLFIRNRHASVRPVMQNVGLPHPCILLGKCVQHDGGSGTDAQLLGRCDVFRVWIPDVEGFVKVASRVSRIEYVNPLGSPAVAMPSLRPDGFATKSNLVRAYFLPLGQKHELPLALVNNDAVYADTGLLRKQGPTREQDDAR